MMQKTKSPNVLAAALAICLAWQSAWAQDGGEEQPPEEELEMIDLDAERGRTRPDDGLESIEYDEATRSYRLVVDDEGDDYVEPPSERETQLAELQRLFDLYREALTNKDYLEADTLAKRVVELSIRLNGLDSHDSAKAITNLGIAQHNNGDYESALRNFMASIDIIERIDDNLSPALVNPLQGLAATHAAVGRPDLARLAYQRAVHVTHVNEGPHNKDQIDILSSMAELNISQSNFEEAADLQERVFSIQSRNIDPESMEMIPALERRASWQHRLQQYHRERVTWRQIINIIERHHGKDSLELLSPLTNLGKSYLFVSPVEYEYQPDVSTSSGESYLRRAYRIASEHPDSTWQAVENQMLSLGDFYILSGRPNRAKKSYEETWIYLSEGDDPEKLKARRDHLEKVKVLQRVFPPKYYNSERKDDGRPPPENFEAGTISFTYIVSPSGRVVNLQHLETQPREVADFDKVIGRSLRRLMYRPRMKDGTVVATGDVVYTHDFYYRPSDLEGLPPADEPADADTVSQDDTSRK
jgi:tetratricopeptide (TPR) repeat protein